MNLRSPAALWTSALVLGLITSCNQTVPSSDPQPTATVASPSATTPAPTPESSALPEGESCFTIDHSTMSSSLRLMIAEDGRVSGSSDATIFNAEEQYYSSYTQTFEGEAVGEQLELDVVTQIEGDTQNTQETWTLSGDTLQAGRDRYTRADCDSLEQPSALGTNPEEPEPSTVETIDAEPGSPEPIRVQFRSGSTSAELEGAVIRGTRNTYLLGASANQTMIVDVTSVEDNAVFDIVSPEGELLQQEATRSTVTLPASGDYQIVVGGTRGNATYNLRIEIN